MSTADSLSKIISDFNELQNEVYEIARANNGRAMGQYSWLRYAIGPSSINLDWYDSGIQVWGDCYTSQTQSNEVFSFAISPTQLEAHRVEKLAKADH